MKLSIGVNLIPINGYTTIDPTGGEGKTAIDFRNLDSVCDTSECTEINAPDILNFIHGSDLMNTLQNWVMKLRHGGKIIIGGSDLFECCKSVVLGQISVSDANLVFYNKRDSAWSTHFGMYECNEIVGLLSELGLKIDKKRINGNCFVVEAHRE